MPKIYTKTGDKGETGLGNGRRVSKDSARVEAIGAVDEVNAFLGVVSAKCGPTFGWQTQISKLSPRKLSGQESQNLTPNVFGAGNSKLKTNAADSLRKIQKDLFYIGACLGKAKADNEELARIFAERTRAIENDIDTITSNLPHLTNFILPGGSESCAVLHVARAVCRKAERRAVSLMKEEAGGELLPIIVYLNRLSDFLFTLARWVNMQEGIEEEKWCM